VKRAGFAIVLAARVAAADPAPWEQGVPADKQDAALALFNEGNEFFTKEQHAPALEKYTQALAIWDHPRIRFNKAVTEIRLDRILEAAEDLDAALRYGQAPFNGDLYQRALDDQRLLAGRVGHVSAHCGDAGGSVLLDGKSWFSCPGERDERVLAGEHVVVAEKTGFLTETRRIVVAGGATSKVELVWRPIDANVALAYPTPRWIPWTIGAGGTAVALAGLGVWLSGRSQMNKFDSDLRTACPMGCPSNLSGQPLLADERDGARLKGDIGIVMMLAGGAVAAAGVTWAILNRPRRVPAAEVMPTNGGIAGSVRWTF
jgi:hypothetical protein